MKTIIAILRIHTMNQTKIALSQADIPSFTATGQVYGRGKGKWDAQVMEGVKNNQPEAIALLGPEPRLRLHPHDWPRDSSPGLCLAIDGDLARHDAPSI